MRQRSMCVPSIRKLSRSLRMCRTYKNEEYSPLGLLYPYIDKSQGVTFTGDFFAKKPTSIYPIRSLICWHECHVHKLLFICPHTHHMPYYLGNNSVQTNNQFHKLDTRDDNLIILVYLLDTRRSQLNQGTMELMFHFIIVMFDF